ncbi:hypothetical protein LOTGIDRAFT_169731 [Lottia gigantea]|uniref:Sushi domain-containing protein n=1 Tax=Lottia gigantea TaxID=225164 RepID=V3YY88_LOTGI|nr:hypothetical protein LOTGIDRAFT_169731 [Lottia gigantea]ESO83093.1 hypothetical protein LOTGIDRAFT_169731 [Lottia gigantea]
MGNLKDGNVPRQALVIIETVEKLVFVFLFSGPDLTLVYHGRSTAGFMNPRPQWKGSLDRSDKYGRIVLLFQYGVNPTYTEIATYPLTRGVRCPVDLIGNDMKITAMTGDEPVFEVEATIACARGYNKINGTGLSSCQGNGTWSEFDLQCQRLVCLGNPRTQENAKIASHIPTNSFKGQTLNYSCNEDLNYFYQSGPISSVCEENMLGSLEWIMADMICVYKCSRPPETFPGTKYTLQSVEGQVFDLGYEVIYSCSIIFLSSVTTAQCKTSGWQLGNGVDLLCVVA